MIPRGNYDLRTRFLTYEIFKNADDCQITSWSKKLNDYITEKNLKIKEENIEYHDLLKILMMINSNDVLIDYDKLNKYTNNVMKFINIITSLESIKDKNNINASNDLINKIALVCYNLNRSVEMGS